VKKKETSGSLTRSWLRALGWEVVPVESTGFNRGAFVTKKRDLLGFIDDLAFFDDYMIGVQSCFDTDLEVHKKKFQKLVDDKAPITRWMRCAELWLVWWTFVPHTKGWYPNISILNPHFEIKRAPAPVLQLVK
jgi:hypothetical protein